MNDKLAKKVKRAVDELPPFPKVIHEIQALMADPLVAAERLAEVAKMDPGLTATILRTANSAYYSPSRRIDSLPQAVAYLGNRHFSELLWSVGAGNYLNGNLKGYGLKKGELWIHSLATAIATTIIAERIGMKPIPALYTAGLLHDLGKVVLSAFLWRFSRKFSSPKAQGRVLCRMEELVFDLHHGLMGAEITEQWQFSNDLVALIKHHHHPENQPDWPELAVLYLANIVGTHPFAPLEELLVPDKEDPSLKLLGLKPMDLVEVRKKMAAELDKAKDLI